MALVGNGRYEYAALTTQSMYSCTMPYPQTGKFTSQDICNARYNYEKPASMERESYRWRVERDEYGQKMCLQNAKINGCAYRK